MNLVGKGVSRRVGERGAFKTQNRVRSCKHFARFMHEKESPGRFVRGFLYSTEVLVSL